MILLVMMIMAVVIVQPLWLPQRSNHKASMVATEVQS